MGWGIVLVMEVVEREIPIDNSEGLDPGPLLVWGLGTFPYLISRFKLKES